MINAIVISATILLLFVFLPIILFRSRKRDDLKDIISIYSSYSRILAAIAIPLIIFFVGSGIQRQTVAINQKLDWQKHDLSILQEFQKTYADENTRGLSLRYLKLLKDNDTQIQTRLFVAWDLLRQIIKNKDANLGRKYKFIKTLDNIHYLSQNVNELSEINNGKEAVQFINDLIVHGLDPDMYKNYSSEKQFYLLLSWIVNRSSIKGKLPTESLRILEQGIKS